MNKIWGHPCGSNACYQVTETPERMFVLTSTIEDNDGAVIYTPAEMADFLSDAKAGKLDDLHRQARNLVMADTIA
jgi:hypothetical protein